MEHGTLRRTTYTQGKPSHDHKVIVRYAENIKYHSMILWTIQTTECYQKLLSDSIIYGIQKHIDLPHFLYGYKWLMDQMDKRIGMRPFSGCYPIWAWYQWDGAKKPRPDLRSAAHLPKGTKGVRIEIEKVDKEVLLSDFDLWHFPLSYHGYIGNSEEDENAFERTLAQRGLDNAQLDQLADELQQQITESWDRIFKRDSDDPYFTRPRAEKSIQATFWCLTIDEIRKVDEFTAR